MKALRGDFTARARLSLDAGCDVVLHCNGDMDEMRAVAAGARLLAGRALERAEAVLAGLSSAPEAFDAADGRARLAAILAKRWVA
jgi:beta-N-acetylhexosaminidase